MFYGRFFTKIPRYNRIRNRRNDFSFNKYHLILLQNKTILKTIKLQMICFKRNVVYSWIFHCGYLLLNNCVWLVKVQEKNNIYTCVNSTESEADPNFLHQPHMNTKTLLCVIINLLYLNVPDEQLLWLYMIPQYWTDIVSYFLSNQW